MELIRVLAVTGVFLFHLWSVIPLSGQDGALGWVLFYAARFGNLGVPLFNMVTGFVLALPYLGPEHRPAPAYGDFLRRRFLRICPNYYVALVLWTLVLLAYGVGAQRESLGSAFLAHLLFLHTLSPSLFFSIVPAYWWLGLLAQFYFFFPILLRLFQRIGSGTAALFVCAASWLLWAALVGFSHARPGSAWATLSYMWYFNLPARLPEFALGMWIAAAWNPGRSARPAGVSNVFDVASLAAPFRVFVAVALAYALVSFTSHIPAATPWGHVHATAWCLLLVVGIMLSPLAARAVSLPGLLSIATASYSIYLLHQPILHYADRWLKPYLSPTMEVLVLLIVGGMLSYLSARILDRFVAALWRWSEGWGTARGGRDTAP